MVTAKADRRPPRVRAPFVFALAVASAVLATTTAGRLVPDLHPAPHAAPPAWAGGAPAAPTPSPAATAAPTLTPADVQCVRQAPRVCFTVEHRARALALLPVLDRLYSVARARGYGELVPTVVTERAAAFAPSAGAGAPRGARQMFVLYDEWPDQRMVADLTGTLVQPDCPSSSPYFQGVGTGYSQRAFAVAATWQWLIGDGFPRGTFAGQSPLTPEQVHRVLEDFARCSAPRVVGVTSDAGVFAGLLDADGRATAGVVVSSEAREPVVVAALARAARRIRLIDQDGREYPDRAAFAAAYAVDDSRTVPFQVSGVHLTPAGPAVAATLTEDSISGSSFAVTASKVVAEELRRSGVLDASLTGLSALPSAVVRQWR